MRDKVSSVPPDFEETMNNVSSRSETLVSSQHGIWVGVVQHCQLRMSVPLPEDLREDRRGEARTTHPEQHDSGVTGGADLLDELVEARQVLEHQLGECSQSNRLLISVGSGFQTE